ncbi:uncharacterized protein [Engystomops pustulosus]|uniref:uncharacterized protein isoform X3 n=1 Tax=Engystomops pustulosus TaxID=76066 RepID=UPI003AFAAC0F
MDRKSDFLLKKLWESSMTTIKTNIAATSVSHTLLFWLGGLEDHLREGTPREEILDSLPLLKSATAFLADASAESIRFASRDAALSNATRRALWLKQCSGDICSKAKLCSLPFSGEFLFGSELDEILDKAADKKKGFPEPRPTPKKQFFFVALEQTKTNQRIRGDLPGDKASGIVPGEEKTSHSCSVPQTNQKRSNDARVGGRLKDFLPQWKNITNNRQSSGSLTHHLWEQVSTLQKLEVVCPVPPEEKGTGHYSPLFLIKKPNGSYRLIINLKFLNKWVTYIKFKMESIKSTTPLINHNAFLCTLDLRDAYYHIPIHADSQKFLRFAVVSPSGEESHFQFTALPFGLSSAPRIFTKVMAEVVKYLRTEEVLVVPYLDDFLLVGDSEKVDRLLLKIKDFQKRKYISIRAAMSLLGSMTSCIQCVAWCQIQTRPLQSWILSKWDKDYHHLNL